MPAPILTPLVERLGRRALLGRGFSTRFVPTRIGRVYVYEAPGLGSSPTVVVLHGLGSNAVAFAPFMMMMRAHTTRIVAIDYPGHGFSERAAGRLTPDVLFETVSEALDQVVPEKAIVIGNSLGGGVALNRAVRHPEKVHALVLLSPAGARSSDADWEAIRRTFAVKNRAEARAFLDRLYHRTSIIGRVLAHEMPASLGRREVVELLASATNEHAPAPEALSALTMPILFFWGASERIFSTAQLEYFKAHLPPHAVIDRAEGFGHCPHLDRPRDLVRTIARFLATPS